MLQIAPHFHTHTPPPALSPTLSDGEQQSRRTSGMATSTLAPNQGEAVGSPFLVVICLGWALYRHLKTMQ